MFASAFALRIVTLPRDARIVLVSVFIVIGVTGMLLDRGLGFSHVMSYLYFIPIITTAILFSLQGGLLIALIASIPYVTIAALEAGGLKVPLLALDMPTLPLLIHKAVTFVGVGFFVGGLATLIRYHQREIEAVVESVQEGIVALDRKNGVIEMNSAAGQMFGVDAGSSAGVPITRYIQHPFLDDMTLTDTRPKKPFALTLSKRPRARYEALLTPLRDGRKFIGRVLVLRDVTQEKEVGRLKTEFVSVAAHQLRTPLTAIRLLTELLAGSRIKKLPGREARYVREIHESTKRMTRLVNDLLNVARLESGRLKIEPKPTNLLALVRKVVQEIKPLTAVRKGCRIQIRTSGLALPPVPTDAPLLRHVLYNLITNAVQYSPARRSVVEVMLENKGKDGSQITIQDEGIGVPQEAQGKLFEKFFRAGNAMKYHAEGSGLGLYVAKMIMEGAGGKIGFISQEGQGATFYIQIPKEGMKEHKGEKGLA